MRLDAQGSTRFDTHQQGHEPLVVASRKHEAPGLQHGAPPLALQAQPFAPHCPELRHGGPAGGGGGGGVLASAASTLALLPESA